MPQQELSSQDSHTHIINQMVWFQFCWWAKLCVFQIKSVGSWNLSLLKSKKSKFLSVEKISDQCSISDNPAKHSRIGLSRWLIKFKFGVQRESPHFLGGKKHHTVLSMVCHNFLWIMNLIIVLFYNIVHCSRKQIKTWNYVFWKKDSKSKCNY